MSRRKRTLKRRRLVPLPLEARVSSADADALPGLTTGPLAPAWPVKQGRRGLVYLTVAAMVALVVLFVLRLLEA